MKITPKELRALSNTVGMTYDVTMCRSIFRSYANALEVCYAAKAVSENTGQSDCPASLLAQLQEASDKLERQ